MKIRIKPKEINEQVLQKQSLRVTQKEMKSIQKRISISNSQKKNNVNHYLNNYVIKTNSF